MATAHPRFGAYRSFGGTTIFGGCRGLEQRRDRWFRGGQWSPIQLFFGIAYAMLGPPFRRWLVLEELMRTRTKCPCSRPGAGACAVLQALLLRALGSPSRQKSLRWRVHCPLWHKFRRNQAAIQLHLRNTLELVTTQSRETTKGTNRYPNSALDR